MTWIKTPGGAFLNLDLFSRIWADEIDGEFYINFDSISEFENQVIHFIDKESRDNFYFDIELKINT